MMANILPFAEPKPAILSDGDGFLANVVTVCAVHGDVPLYGCEG